MNEIEVTRLSKIQLLLLIGAMKFSSSLNSFPVERKEINKQIEGRT
jgi:hypothetical protein